MKISIEEFVKANREKADVHTIDERVWHRTLGEMRRRHRKPAILQNMLFIKVAAVFLLITSIYFLFKKDQPIKNTTAYGIVNELYPAYAVKIKVFSSEIEHKKTALLTIKKQQPDIYRIFITDLAQLNLGYETLLKEIHANPNRKLLLSEMIENLELQLRMLTRQLILIKQLQAPKPSTNEKQNKNI